MEDAGSTARLPGSACIADEQCAGATPLCRTHYGAPDAGGQTPIEGGICSAYCDESLNDPYSMLNPGCPGGTSACASIGAGLCVLTCTAQGGYRPCPAGQVCTSGFLPFAACYPAAHIACDPNELALCADMAPYDTCVFVGPDLSAGGCHLTCDLFAQDCNSHELALADGSVGDAGLDQACYPNTFGQGYCTNAGAGGPGMPCPCAAGNGCQTVSPPDDAGLDAGPTSLCEPFCGGPNAVPCPAGLQCLPYSLTVPASVVGLCSPDQ